MGTIDPGEGFRLLVRGEVIEKTDSFLSRNNEWEPAYHYSVGSRIDIDDVFRPYRRMVEIPVHTGGPHIAIEVHRAALAEIEVLTLAKQAIAVERDAADQEVKRLKAQLDAIKQPQPDPEPEWFDLTPFDEHVLRENVDYFLSAIDAGAWKVVRVLDGETVGDIKDCGYTLFRCLLKDAPPELVAKAKQTESPDDWVTQDRVPARPGIDERQWVQYDGTALGWVPVKKIGWSGMKHGDVIHGDRLEIRCRRRDLPPLPQQPKTETVVFYEFMVRCGVGNEDWQLKWRTSKPKTNNWIPTGRTETREVVR